MPILGEMNTRMTPEETYDDLDECFRKWGVTEWGPRLDKRKRMGTATIEFVLNGQPKHLNCDRFPGYADNLRSIYLALEALRLAAQRGILEEFRQFFIGIEAPATDHREPWEWLQVAENASYEVANAAYRRLAKLENDRGGADLGERLKRLNIAMEWFKEREKAVAR